MQSSISPCFLYCTLEPTEGGSKPPWCRQTDNLKPQASETDAKLFDKTLLSEPPPLFPARRLFPSPPPLPATPQSFLPPFSSDSAYKDMLLFQCCSPAACPGWLTVPPSRQTCLLTKGMKLSTEPRGCARARARAHSQHKHSNGSFQY